MKWCSIFFSPSPAERQMDECRASASAAAEVDEQVLFDLFLAWTHSHCAACSHWFDRFDHFDHFDYFESSGRSDPFDGPGLSDGFDCFDRCDQVVRDDRSNE